MIAEMRKTLTVLGPQLEEKSIAVEILMTNLAKEQAAADVVRSAVKIEEEAVLVCIFFVLVEFADFFKINFVR